MQTIIRILHSSELFMTLPHELFVYIVTLSSSLHWITFINVSNYATSYQTSASRPYTIIPVDGLKVSLCNKKIRLCCGTLRTLRPNQNTVVFAYNCKLPSWLPMLKPSHACMIV